MTFKEDVRKIETQLDSAFRLEEMLTELGDEMSIEFGTDRIIVSSDETDKKLHLVSLRANPEVIQTPGKLKATISEMSIIHSDGSIEELPVDGVIDVELTYD